MLYPTLLDMFDPVNGAQLQRVEKSLSAEASENEHGCKVLGCIVDLAVLPRYNVQEKTPYSPSPFVTPHLM